MTKIASRFFKGIEFVQLDDLPEDQRKQFTEWLERDHLINIQIGQKIEKNCVQYADYIYWFEQVFNKPNENKERTESKTNQKQVGLAFDR